MDGPPAYTFRMAVGPKIFKTKLWGVWYCFPTKWVGGRDGCWGWPTWLISTCCWNNQIVNGTRMLISLFFLSRAKWNEMIRSRFFNSFPAGLCCARRCVFWYSWREISLSPHTPRPYKSWRCLSVCYVRVSFIEFSLSLSLLAYSVPVPTLINGGPALLNSITSEILPSSSLLWPQECFRFLFIYLFILKRKKKKTSLSTRNCLRVFAVCRGTVCYG